MRKFKDTDVVLETEGEGGAITNKPVKVAPFDVQGLMRLAEEVRAVDLPLPKLDTDQVMGWVGEKADLTEAVIEIFTKNLPAIFKWLTTIPTLLPILLEETTNLAPEEVASLSAGQGLKVARASWVACVEDGAFSEMAGFFGDLFRGAAGAGANLISA